MRLVLVVLFFADEQKNLLSQIKEKEEREKRI